MNNKRIIITGGAGFIGSALVKEIKFQYQDSELYIIDNLSFGSRSFLDIEDKYFFEVDIRDKPEIENILNQINPQIVIHLAAIHFIPYCNQNPFESSEINLIGTQIILETCEKIKSVEKVLFASTAAVYPISDEPHKETDGTRPMDIYGLSKLMGEKLCMSFASRTKIPTIAIRFFNAFGPNETNPHLIPEIAKQINQGQSEIELGNLDPKRDFIHTSDMAKAMIKLIQLQTEGFDIFNLGRGEEYSVLEIVSFFEMAIGRKISIIQDPNRIRKTERMHLLADITKLKNAIDWVPTKSPVDGMETLLE